MFRHLKVGDKVTKLLSSAEIPMDLIVCQVLDDTLKCGISKDVTDEGSLWTFCRDTGAEIDDYLQWGPKYGITGSKLRKGAA